MWKSNPFKKEGTMKIAIQDHLYALGQRNLVYNYNFKYFSNRNNEDYGVPDGWVYTDKGKDGYIKFDATTQEVILIKSDGNETMTFTQALHEFPRWQEMLCGEIVTGKVELSTENNGAIHISLSDGLSTYTVTKSTKGASTIDLQLKIEEKATQLVLKIETQVPLIQFRVKQCYVNIGKVSVKHLPCMVEGIIGERKQYIATENPPAEELSLCKAAVELDDQYTRLNSVLNYRFGKGEKGNSLLIDMRGYFSRAWDNGALVDASASDRTAPGKGILTGDHVSTVEQDSFLKHEHPLNFTVNTTQSTTGGSGPTTNLVTPVPSKTKEALDGKETRPKNIAELYTIKWA